MLIGVPDRFAFLIEKVVNSAEMALDEFAELRDELSEYYHREICSKEKYG